MSDLDALDGVRSTKRRDAAGRLAVVDAYKAAGSAFKEAVRAYDLHGEFKSVHEGLGVLTEEYYELIEAIHANHLDDIEAEATQVAAMAIRLVSLVRQQR